MIIEVIYEEFIDKISNSFYVSLMNFKLCKNNEIEMRLVVHFKKQTF